MISLALVLVGFITILLKRIVFGNTTGRWVLGAVSVAGVLSGGLVGFSLGLGRDRPALALVTGALLGLALALAAIAISRQGRS
jgi:hypothetical protein